MGVLLHLVQRGRGGAWAGRALTLLSAASVGSVTVRIIGRRVDFTVRINPLMSTPPLQEGLPSRASTNQMQASCGSGMSRKKEHK